MKNTRMRFTLILIVLFAASLACNLPGSASNLPPTAQPMSTQQVQNLENQVQQTLENPNAAGEVSITLTQDQLNSIITGEIQQQPDLGISDPSVILTGGHMEVYGKVTRSNISADLKVVLQPQIDANGNPRLNITSMDLGGLPVPDVLKNRVNTVADDALASYLGSSSSSIKAKSITIGEGQMTITGTRQ